MCLADSNALLDHQRRRIHIDVAGQDEVVVGCAVLCKLNRSVYVLLLLPLPPAGAELTRALF
jgi:hypothetical protein